MFKELAFTPFVFDEAMNTTNNRWSDSLRRLLTFLFPEQSPSQYMVSNLHDGNWNPVLTNIIDDCPVPSAKILLQQFQTKVDDLLVIRPSVTAFEYPGGPDETWAIEALKSDKVHGKIDQIFACSETAQGHENICVLNDILMDSFVETLMFDNLVPMVMDEQLKVLEKILLHASYISMSSAYFHASELYFAKALITKVGDRPSEFDNAIIDIHIQAPESEDDVSHRVSNIQRQLQGCLTGKTTVRLFVWEKLRERVLLAGDVTTVSGEQRLKARWGVNTSHIARSGECDPEDKTPWSVMTQTDIIHWNKRFYQTTPKLGPLIV